MTQPVIVLEFNELCPSLMDKFISEGKLPGFKALRSQSLVHVTDAGEEPPNLEPWIQWVTVHTGLPFSTHRVFELGDAHKLKAKRIWDYAVESGKSVWICGSMNADIQKPSAKTWFLPDPWSSKVRSQPNGEFDIFCNLAWKYVQEHARDSAPWSKRDYLNFAFFMLKRGLSVKTMWKALLQLAQDLPNKALRWRRAIILDRLQWDLFRHYWKKKRPDFSTFFLNSTAHFQHYHWREMEPERFSSKEATFSSHAKDAILAGYQAMDDIVQECLRMAPGATIILMTALSQQPLLRYEAVGGKYIFKPTNPQVLMELAGVKGAYKYAPVMAEEFRLYMNSEEEAKQACQALGALRINGQPLMRIGTRGAEVFGGCDVISAPARNELVISTQTNHSMAFGELFYQADGAKSGCHHPDGIFWIRTPGGSCMRGTQKLPLVDAAHMLADIAGVQFEHEAAGAEKAMLMAS